MTHNPAIHPTDIIRRTAARFGWTEQHAAAALGLAWNETPPKLIYGDCGQGNRWYFERYGDTATGLRRREVSQVFWSPREAKKAQADNRLRWEWLNEVV